MARISGVNIPSGKRIEIALTYVYGIGATRAKQICKDASLDANKRVNNLTEDELSKIREIVKKSIIEASSTTISITRSIFLLLSLSNKSSPSACGKVLGIHPI